MNNIYKKILITISIFVLSPHQSIKNIQVYLFTQRDSIIELRPQITHYTLEYKYFNTVALV